MLIVYLIIDSDCILKEITTEEKQAILADNREIGSASLIDERVCEWMKC